jgi:hypothetical protein
MRPRPGGPNVQPYLLGKEGVSSDSPGHWLTRFIRMFLPQYLPELWDSAGQVGTVQGPEGLVLETWTKVIN